MPHRKLITKVLQRYWRATRGLRLEVRACVRDAAGNWLLVREDEGAPWRLPGGVVARGETAAMALSRWLAAQSGLEVVGEPRLIAMHAGEDGPDAGQSAIFLVPSWRLRDPGAHPGPRWSFFAPGRLPHGLEPCTIASLREAA